MLTILIRPLLVVSPLTELLVSLLVLTPRPLRTSRGRIVQPGRGAASSLRCTCRRCAWALPCMPSGIVPAPPPGRARPPPRRRRRTSAATPCRRPEHHWCCLLYTSDAADE